MTRSNCVNTFVKTFLQEIGVSVLFMIFHTLLLSMIRMSSKLFLPVYFVDGERKVLGSKCVFRCKHSMTTIHQNNTDVVINHELYDITSISYTIDLYPKRYSIVSFFDSCRPSSVTIPPHLFGALAYTEEGRSLLLRHIKISGWFEILKDITKNPLERRSILWAFTHIAVAPHGLEFLNVFDLSLMITA